VTDLRVAIIGYGLAGRVFHAPLIASTAGLDVAIVVTRNPQRAAQAQADHPAASVLPSVEAALDAKPDLVVVATPNDTHAATATAALTRGIPVVVDKPLAVSAAEARSVAQAADRAGAMLTVFQNRRWDSDQLTLRALLDQDALGQVVRYESRFERWRPEPAPDAWRERSTPQAGGGQLLDLGSHLVDQALVLFGPATHVYAEVEARRGLPGDDDVFIALRHGAGPISHLHAGAVMPAPGPRLRVQGTRAGFLVNGLDPQEAALHRGERPDGNAGWGRGEEWERGRLVAGERSVPVPAQPGDWPRFYALTVRALRDGGPPPVDPADAVAVLDVLEAARHSAASRQTVALDRSGGRPPAQ
jgi:scyllo-inositol 2-dehydrogenase (NADP+)